ncbi:SpoIID/LytB domain-containing protein [Bacillus sp. FJAT-45037]|uniref:SpoIID/LytB domain-containing protein n=1 Tax=Bacillus sp. FJAT-45037 TaxID=2011007 RepID=UPI0012FDB221|nr:SpoIID/LytB domain-containing protein [Bacillus sp. FJAT-45037]
MKIKGLQFLLIFGLCLFVFQSEARAFTSAPYQKPVTVTLDTNGNSFPVVLNGLYELHNRSTNEKVLLQPGTSITISRNGSNITLQTLGRTYQSPNGFTIQEMKGNNQINTFSSATTMRRGALSSYDAVTELYRGEAAKYLGQFTNNHGQLWFNIETSTGQRGWVPATTTFQPRNIPTLALATYKNRQYRGTLEFTTNGASIRTVNRLDIEEYLKGVVPGEMPPSWHLEALKAQAIAARSYALNTMNLTTTPASQVYGGYTSEHPRSNQAVDETKKRIVSYNGKPVQAFFFSTSGGRTANIGDVWNSSQSTFPYFASVNDPYENSPHGSWTESYNSRTLLDQFGFGPSAILLDIQVNKSGQNGEVRAVTLHTTAGNKTITGNENQIRRIFPSASAYGFLRSNWFDLASNQSYTVQNANNQQKQFSVKGQQVQTATGISTITSDQVHIQSATGTAQLTDSDPRSIVLTGKGWGHRIGMSQYGAKGFAEQGRSAEQILRHYYTGTTISQY